MILSMFQKKREFPHTFVILFCIIAVMTLLTHIVPAGVYDRVTDPNTGRSVVDPESFAYVEATPVSFFGFLNAIPDGMVDVADIMTFIFVVGGAFNIITETGAMEKGVRKLAYKLSGREKLLIPMMMFIFSLGGATFGMAEEVIIFVPIGIALARALGYDALVGMAMMVMGAAIGFSSGFLNPFSVGVAQGIAELPTYSGMGLRIVVWLVMVVVVPWRLMQYANRVKKDPKASYIYELELEQKGDSAMEISDVLMTGRDKLVLSTIVLGLVAIVVGVITQGWYVIEISAVFLAMGVVGGVVAGQSANEMARSFVRGAQGIAMGALVVGVARGILVVMSDGQILDTIVNALASVIILLPKSIAAIGMLAVQCCINFFIPSGSGQASATMPIMIPLADIIGMTRQTAVLAFQFGDGFTNAIIPTHGTLCACLGMSGISFDKWFKFALPIVGVELLICCGFLVFATVTGYGPF